MHVPIENIVAATKAKDTLDQMIKDLAAQHIYVLTQEDRPAAVLISVDHLKELINKKDMPDIGMNKPEAPKAPDMPKKDEPFSPLTPAKMSTPSFSPPPPPKPFTPPEPPKPAGQSPLGGAPTTGPLVTEKEVDKVVSDTTKPATTAPFGSSSTLPPLPPLPKTTSPFSSGPTPPPPLPPLPPRSAEPDGTLSASPKPATPPMGSTSTPTPPEPPKITSPFNNLPSSDIANSSGPKPTGQSPLGGAAETPKPPTPVGATATAKTDEDLDTEIL